MLDLYALPSDFPGWEKARKQPSALERVTVLEQALREEFDDPRFHPYIQLHEFEALLYCDLSELSSRVSDSQHAIQRLQSEVAGVSPEEINDGPETAPSKRIISCLPIYESSKVRVGAAAAAAIGLPALRARCPHFDDWITHLERLSEPLE